MQMQSIPSQGSRQVARGNRKRSRKRHKTRPRYGDLPLCFGRFAGRRLADVPESYLRWALTANVPETDKWLIEMFLGVEGAIPRGIGR